MRVSRRKFLKLSSIALGGAALSACRAGGSPAATASGAFIGNSAVPAAGAIPAAGTDLVGMVILGRPTDGSIAANCIPVSAANIFYEYGTAPGKYGSQTAPQSAAAGAPLETLIGGLQPDTRYYYRIRSGDGAGEERSFMTQCAPGSSFTFDVQADSHPERINKSFSPVLYPITLAAAAADRPDFFVTLGDDFSVDQMKTVNPETVTALYRNQRQWLGRVGAPVFLVNGNHEQAAMINLDGTPDNVAVWAQTARNSLYPQPAPDAFYSGDAVPVPSIGLLRDYYAFTWGDALFVVLDPYWHSPAVVDNAFGSGHDPKGNRDGWEITIGDDQYRWLKRTLEGSAAKYKFVFSHHVLGTGRGGAELAGQFEWGDVAGLPGHRPGWEKTIHQLMADNHVTIFFQGHDHIFVRQELDGVVYQSLPQPADPNYALNNAGAYKTGDKLPGSGYLRVKVAPANVTVDYIRAYLPQDETNGRKSGEVAFTYMLPG